MTAVEDDFDQVEETLAPQPWSWARLAGIGVAAVGNLFNAVALACAETSEAVAAHLAHKADRVEFVESVSADIAKL